MSVPDEHTVERVARAIWTEVDRQANLPLSEQNPLESEDQQMSLTRDCARAAIAAMLDTKALEVADKSTAEILHNALLEISRSGVCDVSRKMKCTGAVVDTREGKKLASLTLTLARLPSVALEGKA